MVILESSTEPILVPLAGPAGMSGYPVSVAVVPEGSGEPATGDYQAASWRNVTVSQDGQREYGDAMIQPSAPFPAGLYMVYARVIAAPADVRKVSGRLRVGDP
jgi:hypothetical protein